jgi:hypothetical protein
MKRLRQAGYFRIADNPGVIACRFKFKAEFWDFRSAAFICAAQKAKISVS